MNNSNYKSNLTKIFNNLSETSNNFLTEINQNINYMNGGSKCHCLDALMAFNKENLDMALYILKNENCCCCCKDNMGNTILHHLVMCCTKHDNNNDCMDVLLKVLKSSNVNEFINIQNANGTTAILLAAENNNDFVANKLDEAGADKSIEDNKGNYLQTEDLTENKTENNTVNLVSTPNEQVCINNVVKLIIQDDKKEPNLTSLNLSSLTDNPNSTSNFDSAILGEKIKEKIVKTFALNNNAPDVNTSLNLTSSDNYLDTDKFINFLSAKYNKRVPRNLDELMGTKPAQNIDLFNDSENTMGTDVMLNKLTNNEDEKPLLLGDENIDTDILIKALDNIRSQKMTNVNVLEGGSNKQYNEQMMGYRNMRLDSDNSENVYQRVNANSLSNSANSKLKKYLKSDNNTSINFDLYYSDAENAVSNNELSRLINSRKNDLHAEVINQIMGMLNKGVIIKNSKPVEATEQNAKLIKSFLYRTVSEKNPQLTGMDKILIIKNMNQKEITDLLTKMPDLKELEENIRKHIEEKQALREKQQTSENKKTDDSDITNSDKKTKKTKKVSLSRSTKKTTKKNKK